MPQFVLVRRSYLAVLLAFSVLLAGCLVALTPPVTADAAVREIEPRPAGAFTADALPTAQMNGVAWDQQVLGNTVYVGGSFSQARPAGAAPGVNQSPRSNLMAYTLSSGVMTSWNPSTNAQVRTVAASPDDSRLYVGGDFTEVAGQSRSRIAAFNTANGQLISTFAPPIGYQVNDIVATDTTVYVAGSYAGVGSQPRANLSAFNASTGDLLGWAPTADRQVLAIELSDDGASVLVGGYFENINGVPIRGLAKLDAVTGALQPWPVAISNAGPDAAVNSLHVEGDVVFGTSFHFGPGGNMEGPWQLKVSTGETVWVADCHGDTYDAFPSTDTVYTVGHQHYCGNTSMGFPQYNPWRFQHSMAWTREATGTNIREVHGYANWDGRPSPSIVSWLPSMSIGSFTRQYQAGWTVEGTDDYVVIGGEFPRVNNVGQQGLVRFAKAPLAPNTRGPAFTNGVFVPTVQAVAPGEVKVSWTAGFDMDDRDLTYQVVRSPGGIVHTTEAASVWWDTPGLSYVDTGLTPGQAYSYSVRARDAAGNQVFGSSRSVTVPQTFERTAYGEAVLEDEPEIYWPLNEASGTIAVADHAGGYPGTPGSAVDYGVPGAITGDTAVSVSNNNNGRIHARANSHAPTEMSAEVWFRTTATSGRLLGFGDLMTGNSARRDRQIYLANDGRVHFGVLAKGTKVVSSGQRYNDNQWHQAVATLTGSTQRLYVDGVLVAQRHDVIEPEEYVGHWRLGGDNQSGWPNAGNSNFTGGMDELSIYDYALTPQQVNAHFAASGRSASLPQAPADAYGTSVFELEPDLYWRLGESDGSRANDASILNNAGTYQGAHSKGQAGALADVADSAVAFDGSSGFVSSDNAFTNPRQFSTEAWFRTTSTNGGKIVGFGNARTGLSNNYDRHTFIRNDGRLVFGAYTGQENRVTSTESYNDGEWHHVVSSLSGAGMQLFVDGGLVGSHPNTGAENYTGFWRVGGDRVWGGASSNFLNGSLDEVAVYSKPLTAQQIQAHYVTGSNDVPNVTPTAEFTSEADHLEVAFDATRSEDTDGTIASYSWNFGDGSSGTGATPAHTYAESGTYAVTLTVTDDEGASDSSTRDVEVRANAAPVPVFDDSVAGLTASFDASATSDTDGTVVSYTWDFGNGSSATGSVVTHTYADGGTYEVTLTVTDDDGARAELSRAITVAAPPPNAAPSAVFDSTVTNLQVAVDAAESSDDDGEITSYNWDFGDGSSAAGLQATHTYAEAGTFEVTLTVTDDKGANDTATEAIIVVAPPQNQAPTAGLTVSTSDLTVNVDGSTSTDTDGEIASYAWSFGDGGTASTPTATHTYTSAGTYAVRLTVTDDDGATDARTESVTVVAPAVNAAPEAAFTASTAGLTASLDASGSSDPDGTVETYSWAFGDGQSSSQQQVSHTYAAPGTYDATLTVTDDDGATDSVTQSVTVTAPPPTNQTPTAAFTAEISGLTTQVDARTSNDPDGTIASYGWGFGDGTGGSGSTASHTYTSAGTYTVTLTVVDDDGATDEVTREVTVSAPPMGQAYALDSFARQVANGFGVAELGGSWSSSNAASLYRVSDGAGRMTMTNPGSSLTTGLNAVAARDVNATVDLAYDKAPTGTGTYGTLMVRREGNDAYRLRARAMPTGTQVLLSRTVGGAETVLSNTMLPWVYQPGQVIRMRLVADGANSTSLTGRIWRAGEAEPTTWQVSATDSTASLQDAGSVAVFNYLAGSATNAPVVGQVDNLSVASAGGAPPPNTAPVAAMTTQVSDLRLDVDGRSSTDADGTISAYAWSFGDGATATGSTATHTYASPGTYTVSLQVTDNGGATHTVTRSVAATAAQTNTPPVADFTFTTEELVGVFDAGLSADPDGEIASYDWDFGDGDVGEDADITHTYAEPGTYDVVLTVTDDEGAEDTATERVVVTEAGTPQVLASDRFERSVTSGFGTADNGGAWAPLGSSAPFSVSEATGSIRMAAAGSGPRIYLPELARADVDVVVRVSLDKAPAGGDTYLTVATRRMDNSEYRLKTRLMANGSTMVILTRSVNGVELNLRSATVSGLTYSAGDVLNMRFTTVGAGTTTLSGKVWRVGQDEPAAWQVSATDTSATLQEAGGVGLQTYISGLATNAPVVARFDELLATAP